MEENVYVKILHVPLGGGGTSWPSELTRECVLGGGSLELPEERKHSLIFMLTPSFQGKNIIFSVARGKQPSLEKGRPEGPQWFQTVQKLFCCLAPTLSSLEL